MFVLFNLSHSAPYLPNSISSSHFSPQSSQSIQKQISHSSSRTMLLSVPQDVSTLLPSSCLSPKTCVRIVPCLPPLPLPFACIPPGIDLGPLRMRQDGRWALQPALKSMAAPVIAARGTGPSAAFISIGVQGHRDWGKARQEQCRQAPTCWRQAVPQLLFQAAWQEGS